MSRRGNRRSLRLALLGLLLPGPADANGRVPTVAVLAPDASLVAAQESGHLHVWDRASGKQLARIKSGTFFRGAVSAGALVGVVEGEGIRVWQGPTFRTSVRLQTPKLLTMGRAQVSADGRTVAALYPRDGGVGDPDTVGLWDGRRGTRRATITLERGRILGVALSADGSLVALFGDVPPPRGSMGGSTVGPRALLRVYRLAGDRARELLRWENTADRTTYAAAISHDGRLLALGAGERLLLWDLRRRRQVASAATAAVKALFPAPLRVPAVRMPGAHQIAFAADGEELCTLHATTVTGVAIWRVAPGTKEPLAPRGWIKRPQAGGTMRQVAWDPAGKLHLISATYAPSVWVHTPAGDRFALERVLTP